MVKADISNCYPSIYSHAIPWAAVGFTHAKASRAATEWFNELDNCVRTLKRCETQGVGIGPGASAIVAEVILARVDEDLKKKYEFVRFIDDYRAYCADETEAQHFISDLGDALAKYKLRLNTKKTGISILPQAHLPAWRSELAMQLRGLEYVNASTATTFLSLAMTTANEHPEGSVVKYALKSLIRSPISPEAKFELGYQVIDLAFHQPNLLPSLGNLLDIKRRNCHFSDEFQKIAYEHASKRRSDGVCWSLYFLKTYGVKVPDQVANEVLASHDCMSLIMLYISGETRHRKQVIDFAKSLREVDNYDKDKYWLLLYKIFEEGRMGNPYTGDDTFKTLKDNRVSFMTT